MTGRPNGGSDTTAELPDAQLRDLLEAQSERTVQIEASQLASLVDETKPKLAHVIPAPGSDDDLDDDSTIVDTPLPPPARKPAAPVDRNSETATLDARELAKLLGE